MGVDSNFRAFYTTILYGSELSVSFTLRPLHKTLGTLWTGGWVAFTAGAATIWREAEFLPLSGIIESRTFSPHPAYLLTGNNILQVNKRYCLKPTKITSFPFHYWSSNKPVNTALRRWTRFDSWPYNCRLWSTFSFISFSVSRQMLEQ
jgi:hypothetical protein